jgi:hypothetical protein
MRKVIIILSMFISIAGTSYALANHCLKVTTDDVYICVSKTGHKYHGNNDCRGLRRCTHEIRKVTKGQAIKMGYSACNICY